MEDVARVLDGCRALDGQGAVASGVREVVTVTGPDAGRFLQGQLSQEVVALSGAAWSFLLAPTGKVDAWLRVHRPESDRYLLEVADGWGHAVATRLRRFLLRTDATVAEPERWSLLQVRWGPDVVRVGVADDEPLRAPVTFPGDAGVDVLVEPGGSSSVAGFDPVPAASMERHRIAHAVPLLGAELTDETIPAEAGQWVIDESVSFTKGCYTGQELVARIDSRGGNVPRPVRLLRLDADGAMIGDVVHVDGGATVGALTSVTPRLADDRPALALAPLARSVAIGSSVAVRTAAGTVGAVVVEPATVR